MLYDLLPAIAENLLITISTDDATLSKFTHAPIVNPFYVELIYDSVPVTSNADSEAREKY